MSHLPHSFIEQMHTLLGANEAQDLFDALEKTAPKSIRWNTQKVPPPSAQTPSFDSSVPWCETAHYVDETTTFTGDPLWHAGYYYVQEASSMLLAQIRELLLPNTIALDLCAAPGGKSTLLLDILPEQSVLVSNEYVPHRANILSENLMKWGTTNTIVTSNAPAQLGNLEGLFDLVVVDAPCSGEGMFRKDLNARNEWTDSSPQICAQRQRDILADIWPALKDGGLMVYSTCTLNTLENEEIVSELVERYGATPIVLDLAEELGMRSNFSHHACYRLMPHRHRGEGFFFCVLRKSGMTSASSPKGNDKVKQKFLKLCCKVPEQVQHWLSAGNDYTYLAHNDAIWAIDEQLLPIAQTILMTGLRVLSLGVPLALQKGKDYAPHPGLAYSVAFNSEQFDDFGLSHEEAISYLAKQAVSLPLGSANGYKLLRCDKVPLGFTKYLGNRNNSLYPNEWRIRYPERVLALRNGTCKAALDDE